MQKDQYLCLTNCNSPFQTDNLGRQNDNLKYSEKGYMGKKQGEESEKGYMGKKGGGLKRNTWVKSKGK